jgi:hypothetical protein
VKEELRKEVECLRTDLQQVRDDRDQSVAQVNTLTAELAMYSEQARTSSKDCAVLTSKVSAFEVCAVNSFGTFSCDCLPAWLIIMLLFRKRAIHSKNKLKHCRTTLQMPLRSSRFEKHIMQHFFFSIYRNIQ